MDSLQTNHESQRRSATCIPLRKGQAGLLDSLPQGEYEAPTRLL